MVEDIKNTVAELQELVKGTPKASRFLIKQRMVDGLIKVSAFLATLEPEPEPEPEPEEADEGYSSWMA